jgi:hypothetical protein
MIFKVVAGFSVKILLATGLIIASINPNPTPISKKEAITKGKEGRKEIPPKPAKDRKIPSLRIET